MPTRKGCPFFLAKTAGFQTFYRPMSEESLLPKLTPRLLNVRSAFEGVEVLPFHLGGRCCLMNIGMEIPPSPAGKSTISPDGTV